MQILQPESLERPKGFSLGVVASGQQVFTAGQIGTPKDPNEPAGDFATQVRICQERTLAILKEAGAEATNICAQRWYVTDLDAYKNAGADLGAAWKATLGRHFPAITLVQVTALIDPRALIEIETHAVVPA